MAYNSHYHARGDFAHPQSGVQFSIPNYGRQDRFAPPRPSPRSDSWFTNLPLEETRNATLYRERHDSSLRGNGDCEGALGAGSEARETTTAWVWAKNWVWLLALLAINCLVCGFVDLTRSAGVEEYTPFDFVGIGVVSLWSVIVAWSSVLRLWNSLSNFCPDTENKARTLQVALIDVAAAYAITLLAFGALFAAADMTSMSRSLSLVPDAPLSLILRYADGVYVSTFVAAGVGFPHPHEDDSRGRPTVSARVVAWTCSLISGTFVTNVVVAVALSHRFNQFSNGFGT